MSEYEKRWGGRLQAMTHTGAGSDARESLFLKERISIMTLHLSIVADVFRNEYQAKYAIEALRRAGFAYDQIGIAMRGHEGIDLQSDLQNLGVSHEDASFYVQEVKAGYTVVSVRPDGREQEAHEIMRRSGALTDAETVASQTSTTNTQRVGGDQARATHQVDLADQHASNTQEDFLQPRSLKPREERVPVSTQQKQVEEAQVRPALVTEQKLDAASLITEQKPSAISLVQQDEVTEKKPSGAPVVQNDQVDKHFPLVEEEHRETTSIDAAETLRRLRDSAQDHAEMLPLQIRPEQDRNRTLMKNGVLLGGLLLGLSTGVLLALLRREQIRQFVLSTAQSVRKQRTSIIRRNDDGE
ncbi:MAG: hypothetical protein PVSMB2_34970 [Ktedonobacteraceae bacterium]